MNMTRTVSFFNLGCKVNSYEAQAMQTLFEHAGYQVVEFIEKADVYVIHTCTVTNIADRKSRQMLHRAKKMNPSAIVVAVGCYVESDAEALLQDDSIDLVIGNQNKKNITQYVEEYRQGQESKKYIWNICKQHEYEELKLETISDRTRAYIKIQDGCNQYCSYCIIPFVRGPARSRCHDEVVSEVLGLTAQGYQEFVLTGIHLSSYGTDRMKYGDEKKNGLLELLSVLDGISGVQRIRLGSLEPRLITDEFVLRLSLLKTICPHFHLSLQSGTDSVLERMNRKYTADMYMNKCQMIRKHFPDAAITTDVIVGFPGETDAEYEQTKKFLKEVQFAGMHIFQYSPRQGTKAAAMNQQISNDVKRVRSSELIQLEEKMRRNYIDSFIGKGQYVLIEEITKIDGNDYMIGHTANYLKVAIPYDKNQYKKTNINQMVEAEFLGYITKEGVLQKEVQSHIGENDGLISAYVFI